MHWYSASTETEHQGQRKGGKWKTKCRRGYRGFYVKSPQKTTYKYSNFKASQTSQTYLGRTDPNGNDWHSFIFISFHVFIVSQSTVIAQSTWCCQQNVMRLLQCKNFPTLIIINCMSCSLFCKCFLHLLPCKVMLCLRIVLLFLFGKTFFP